jgi:predicted ATPase
MSRNTFSLQRARSRAATSAAPVRIPFSAGTAVIGKDVPFPLLQAIADEPQTTLKEALSRLQEAEFLYETTLFPDPEYTFKHPLTHEVAYGSLLGERRRALHARIAAAMEGIYADRLTEVVERLAYRATRGELWEKAVLYLRQAGTKAGDRSAYREAASAHEQALAALAHLPETPATMTDGIDLRLQLGIALDALAEFERAKDAACGQEVGERAGRRSSAGTRAVADVR